MAGNTPYYDVGMASFATDTYAGIDDLFSGSSPAAVTENFPVAANLAIPAFTPVGLASDGTLTPAVRGSVDPDDDIQAIGITTAALLDVDVAQSGAIFRAGCFNPKALNWPASFTTDAQKAAAFRGAPAPTNILIRAFR